MPLKNPYTTKIDSADGTGVKLQCDIDPNDKSLIVGIRPSKGTIQLVVINLIKHLCDDLRELGIHAYRTDGDELLAILTESRPLNVEQIERIRRSSVGLTGRIPSRFLNDRGRSEVRKASTKSSAKSSNSKKRTSEGIKQDRGEGRKTEKK